MFQKFVRTFFISVFAAIMIALPVSAETMLSLKFGPSWPHDVVQQMSQGHRTALNSSVAVGAMFDRRVGIGLDFNFQWHRYTKDSTYADTSHTVPVTIQQSSIAHYLFPPEFFLCIDPVPDLIVRPVIQGQIGPTLMVYGRHDFDDAGNETTNSETGFYVGVAGKAIVDAYYNIGKKASLFAGFEYQFVKSRKQRENTNNQYYYRSMTGPGIHIGFRFLI